ARGRQPGSAGRSHRTDQAYSGAPPWRADGSPRTLGFDLRTDDPQSDAEFDQELGGRPETDQNEENPETDAYHTDGGTAVDFSDAIAWRQFSRQIGSESVV